MNAKVFCLASAKGGSGKTIITANIASFLTDIGKKCLIIDCDAATHGMTLLYLVEVSKNTGGKKQGVFDLSAEDDLSEVVKHSIVKVENGVDLLPATYSFKSGFDPEEKFQESALHNIVNLFRSSYDVILLDAQAGSDKYSRLAMDKNISDEVIIVSEYDPLSAAGIERLKQVVGDDLNYTRTWVLLNKMLPEFIEKFSEFLSITKYLPPIPWNAEVVRSYAKRKLALDVEKGNVFTLSIMRTVSALLGENVVDEIKAWSEKRSYALKEPLEKQYVDAEKELRYAFEAKRALQILHKRKQLIKLYGMVLPLMFIPYIIYKFAADLPGFSNLIEKFGQLNILTLMVVTLLAIIPILYTFTVKIFKTKLFNYKNT
jgi:septum site-determining protein MinD